MYRDACRYENTVLQKKVCMASFFSAHSFFFNGIKES